ncbi:endonuclease/exonuclease/phosphatase family protein [Streptosporangium sp. CA-115845]|uniref:endonuclease/exonuclease/phosphatase family protein n=1 Tax=Streptosporangium sp. CA-115845 TaxID=3240071 RepID=UPI003D950462
MVTALTVNIGAASRVRAELLLRWLAARPEQVFLLTETSAGAGTTYLLDQFRTAGYAVVKTPDVNGERGAALVSRIPLIQPHLTSFNGVSIPGRVAVAALDTQPRTWFLGVYVPSRDRSEGKTIRKQTFIASLLDALGGLPAEQHDHLVIGGDYNVIAADHDPLHPGFLPFEFGMLSTLESRGFLDAHGHCLPGVQAYSWIGRTGDGYRYDYFHVGPALATLVRSCTYLHETRETNLTDHAAVQLVVDVKAARLPCGNPTGADDLPLF